MKDLLYFMKELGSVRLHSHFERARKKTETLKFGKDISKFNKITLSLNCRYTFDKNP